MGAIKDLFIDIDSLMTQTSERLAEAAEGQDPEVMELAAIEGIELLTKALKIFNSVRS